MEIFAEILRRGAMFYTDANDATQGHQSAHRIVPLSERRFPPRRRLCARVSRRTPLYGGHPSDGARIVRKRRQAFWSDRVFRIRKHWNHPR